MMKKQIVVMGAALVMGMQSCHIYKRYERPEQQDVNIDNIYRDAPAVESADSTTMGDLPWREVFTDPKLQDLIERGLANNVDMRQARLNLQAAEAGLKAAKMAFAPSIYFAPQGALTRFDGVNMPKTYTLPVQASWQVDLFGMTLNAKRKAEVSVKQTEVYGQAVQTSIVANIANLYYALLSMDKQLRIMEETAELWDKSVETMKAMKLGGMLNETAVVSSEANAYMIRTSILDLKRSIRETENTMCLLLNEVPQVIERSTIEEQVLPTELKTGVPALVLQNRPDVKAAENALAAAYYDTNSARAAFYPNITITGTAAWTNNASGAVFNPGKWLLSLAGQLTQPIFNCGRNIANLKVAKAQEEIARIAFEQSILKAGIEVSDALFQYNTADGKRQFREQQVDRLKKAVDYTTELLNYGGSTYLDVLTAQQSLLSAQISAESDRLESLQAVVTLYQALGGGLK